MARRRSPKLLFSLLLVLLVVSGIEALSFVVYRLAVGTFFRTGSDRLARTALIAEDPAQLASLAASEPVWRAGSMANELVHPFLGYVQRHSSRTGSLEVGPWGFHQRIDAPPAAEGAYRIGVVGGSVAFIFSFKGQDRLRQQLAGSPAIDGRPVEVVSLALGGMKQPQQLMTVAWMLSVGERFDAIVNIDGFNEVAFGAENARNGVYPAFPRNWWLRVGNIQGLDELEAIGRVAAWSRNRRRLAAAFDGSPIVRTITGNLVWRLLDRAVSDRVVAAEADLAAKAASGLSYRETGPPFEHAADHALYASVAGHWQRASVALERLCRGYGIRYIHLLQPNQYVPDSKPMGAEERAQAFDPEHKRREAVLGGYPQLLKAAPALIEADVDFHDLTRLFADVRTPAYSDTCCHLNQFGNDGMADYLAEVIGGR